VQFGECSAAEPSDIDSAERGLARPPCPQTARNWGWSRVERDTSSYFPTEDGNSEASSDYHGKGNI